MSPAPRPDHQASFMGTSEPPLASITGLVRKITTLTPASLAGWVAASHFVVTWARKPTAAGDSSVCGSTPEVVP
jgi:hypothetical protein